MIRNLESLRKNLSKEYPSHHHKHVDVFSAFWNLVDAAGIPKEEITPENPSKIKIPGKKGKEDLKNPDANILLSDSDF